MSWLTNLRFVAYGRRTVRALESIADSLRILADYHEREWNEEHAPKGRSPVVLDRFDPEKASENWIRERRAELGIFDE